jgi:hypothetical protein
LEEEEEKLARPCADKEEEENRRQGRRLLLVVWLLVVVDQPRPCRSSRLLELRVAVVVAIRNMTASPTSPLVLLLEDCCNDVEPGQCFTMPCHALPHATAPQFYITKLLVVVDSSLPLSFVGCSKKIFRAYGLTDRWADGPTGERRRDEKKRQEPPGLGLLHTPRLDYLKYV